MGEWQVRPALHLHGKTHISIQASRDHYCTPKKDGLPLVRHGLVEVLITCGKRNMPPSKLAQHIKPGPSYQRMRRYCRSLDKYYGNGDPVMSYVPMGLLLAVLFSITNGDKDATKRIVEHFSIDPPSD